MRVQFARLAACGVYRDRDGEIDPQRGGTQRTGAFPYGVFKAKDGYIGIGVFTEPQWEAMIKRIGREELMLARVQVDERPDAESGDAQVIIEEWLATLPNDDEAIRILADELRLPAARLLSVGQFANDPIMSPRMVEKMKAPNGGEMLMLKSPHKFSKTPPEIPGPAARWASILPNCYGRFAVTRKRSSTPCASRG